MFDQQNWCNVYSNLQELMRGSDLNNYGESTGVSQDFEFAVEVADLCNIDHKKVNNFKKVYNHLKAAEKAAGLSLNHNPIFKTPTNYN